MTPLLNVPDKAKREACRSCGAQVAFVTSSSGKWMPVSLAKATRNIFGELEAPSHFADCPNADQHRRKRP